MGCGLLSRLWNYFGVINKLNYRKSFVFDYFDFKDIGFMWFSFVVLVKIE